MGEVVPMTLDLMKAMAQANPVTAVMAGGLEVFQNRRERRWQQFINELLASYDDELALLAERVSDERIQELLMHGIRKAEESTRDEQVRVLARIVADGAAAVDMDDGIERANLLLEMAANLEPRQVELLLWIEPMREDGAGQAVHPAEGEHGIYTIEKSNPHVEGMAEAILFTLQARGLAERVDKRDATWGGMEKENHIWRITSFGSALLRYLEQVQAGKPTLPTR